MKARQIFASIGGWLLSFLVLIGTCLWIKGIVHSFKHHSEGDAVATFFPPYGIYRGIAIILKDFN